MPDKNNISIDVQINTDGQQQINQVTQSFDNLRDSINGLSKPFNTFSNNINLLNNNLSKVTDSIGKLSSQNQEFSSVTDKSTNKVSDLATTFSTLGNIVYLVKEYIQGWTAALTGGLTILIAFAPEILKFITALFKGKDAIDQAKISLGELNKGLSSTDYSKAIEQVNTFKLNIGLAKKELLISIR